MYSYPGNHHHRMDEDTLNPYKEWQLYTCVYLCLTLLTIIAGVARVTRTWSSDVVTLCDVTTCTIHATILTILSLRAFYKYNMVRWRIHYCQKCSYTLPYSLTCCTPSSSPARSTMTHSTHMITSGAIHTLTLLSTVFAIVTLITF